MPLHTSDALILRTYTLGESDRIVVFLTRDRGKKRGVAKNARQSRRRFGGALEPLTHGRVGYVERERRGPGRGGHFGQLRAPPSAADRGAPRACSSLPPLRGGVGRDYVEELGSPLWAIDGEALGYVSYFAELIDEWAQEADPNETLFRLGVSMTDAIAAGVPIEPLARYFEFWLLRLQGVYEVDPRLSEEAQRFLRTARGSSPFALSSIEVSRGALRELEATHRELISKYLEKDLKSVRVLREMRR